MSSADGCGKISYLLRNVGGQAMRAAKFCAQLCFIAGAISVGSSAIADDSLSALALLQECETQSTYCSGYILGFVEGHSAASVVSSGPNGPHRDIIYCAPVGMAAGQVRRIYIAYASQHPADLHKLAQILLVRALIEAFPCQR
jgi:hypothetical protein